MNNCKICISLAATSADHLLDQLSRAEAAADIIEIRFDFLAQAQIEKALLCLPKIANQYLFTYRPKADGGARELSLRERQDFWRGIRKRSFEFEFLVDLEPDIIDLLDFPAGQIILSSHNFDGPCDAKAVFGELKNVHAGVIKMAEKIVDITDAIELFQLLVNVDRGQLVPIAMGEVGKWTRILGPAHGAPIAYTSLDADNETAPGQISATDMLELFRVKALDENTEVYGVIAGDTSHSLSPYMHNPAFHSINLNAVFVPLQVADLDDFITRMVKPETRKIELNFKGFSVTNPHKRAVMRHLDHIDGVARTIGAVNTLKIAHGKIEGYNTDADGFIEPLINRFGTLKDARVAVTGAGGAARACIYALSQKGCQVTVFARDVLRAASLREDFGVAVVELKGGFDDFDIVVNTTPLGTKGEYEAKTIAVAEQLNGVKLVYDLNYNPSETRLVREAKMAGVPAIGGLEMLIAQGAKQFELWTGRKAPEEVMMSAVRNRLGI